MSNPPVTQTFIPGPRLIDGTDLNNLVAQTNAALENIGAQAPLITALTTVGAGTVTAAGIYGGVTNRGGAQVPGSVTDTTDTAAAIITAMGAAAAVGSSFYWTYENGTVATITLSGGANVTVTGTGAGACTIPQLTWARFVVTKTSATAVTIVQIGAGQLAPLLSTTQTTYLNTTVATLALSGLTTAQLAVISFNGGSLKTLVFDTAANIIAANPNTRAGQSNEALLMNNSAVTLTFTGLTGTQVSGLTAVQPATATRAIVSIPSLGSASITGLTNSSIAT